MPTLAVGQKIGKYRVVRLLGTGGMGAVYEVHQPDIEQRAALKILTIDVQTQPWLFQRFINEARAANQIKHPGVVKVYDFGRLDDGTPWLAMEYLDGESLAGRLETALSRPGHSLGLESLWIVGELASVLIAAHQQGIVHRDLKPANVMLVPDPRALTGEAVKLLDFGIAKLHGDDITKSNMMMGTPAYMAPEQFKNAATVDGRADVYALGLIAYQILCGRLPFSGEGAYALMAAKAFDDPLPLSQYASDLPADVVALVMAQLDRDPERRPALVHIESEVRRILGLPTLRRISSADPAASAASALKPVVVVNPQPQDAMAVLDPTLDAPDKAIAALWAAGARTPSGEKVAHLGGSPSTLLPPAEQKPAASAVSSPVPPSVQLAVSHTAPTSPSGSARKRRFYVGTVILALGLISGAVALFWPPSPAPVSDRALTVADLAVVDLAVPTVLDLALPPDLRPGIVPVDLAQSDLAQAQPVRHGRSHACEAREITDACFVTELSVPQRTQIMAAFHRTGVKLCAGESMVLTDLSTHPRIRVAPPSLKATLQPPLLYALRGMGVFKGYTKPAEVEIRCRAH